MTVIMVVISISIVISAVAVFYALYERHQLKKSFGAIEKMLDSAIDGDFSVDSYEETRLSRLESKLWEYLSSSSLSAQNVNKEKDKLKELISDISHQTKTPIANLVLYGELLEASELSEEQKSNVTAVQTQTEKLRFLIDSLVKLSRLENGIISLEKKPAPVYEILQNVYDQLKERAVAKGLEFMLEKTDAIANIDSKWTQEALFNIADNAVKYTDKGSVTISTLEFDMFVRVDVSDTGPEISEEEETKIFGRFYRSPAVKEKEGVGIGLYLAREIISDQGGYIKVKSDKEHTTFSIFLPR